MKESLLLSCPLCHDIFSNAFLCRHCGHSYCYRCIQRWIEQIPSCPGCKVLVVEEKDFVPNQQLRLLGREYKKKTEVNFALNESSVSCISLPKNLERRGQNQGERKASWKEFYLCSVVGLVPFFGPLVNLTYCLLEGDYLHASFYIGFTLLDAMILSSFSASTSFLLLGKDLVDKMSLDVLINVVKEKVKKESLFGAHRPPLSGALIEHIAKETTTVVTDEIQSIFSRCFFNQCAEGLVWSLKTKVIQALFIWNYFKRKIFYVEETPSPPTIKDD